MELAHAGAVVLTVVRVHMHHRVDGLPGALRQRGDRQPVLTVQPDLLIDRQIVALDQRVLVARDVRVVDALAVIRVHVDPRAGLRDPVTDGPGDVVRMLLQRRDQVARRAREHAPALRLPLSVVVKFRVHVVSHDVVRVVQRLQVLDQLLAGRLLALRRGRVTVIADHVIPAERAALVEGRRHPAGLLRVLVDRAACDGIGRAVKARPLLLALARVVFRALAAPVFPHAQRVALVLQRHADVYPRLIAGVGVDRPERLNQIIHSPLLSLCSPLRLSLDLATFSQQRTLFFTICLHAIPNPGPPVGHFAQSGGV